MENRLSVWAFETSKVEDLDNGEFKRSRGNMTDGVMNDIRRICKSM